MKAAIINPYLDTLGGGERYSMIFAQVLSELGYLVDVEWKDPKIRQKLESRFGIDLKKINFIPNVNKGDGYDVCFWVSDGSIPMLRARKNLLHFQVPFHDVNGGSLLNKMKLFRINAVVCNSLFTKKIIDEEFGVKSVVLYPPVDVEKIRPKRKENLIVYVGRFSKLKQSKHQDTLINSFKELYDSGQSDWKMILAGGSDVGGKEYVGELRKMSEGYPVQILEGPNFKTLADIYGKSKIFWSASGFGEDENSSPEKVEHFGISTVEAMSAGAVPILFSAGGNKEIVNNGINGLLWLTPEELIVKTKELITVKKLYGEISEKSIESSKLYSVQKFKSEIEKLL